MNVPSPRAFTLLEMLVVIALVALLVGILVPVLGRSTRMARGSLCQWNVGQLMTAVNLYLKDNREIYPGGERTVRTEDGSTRTFEVSAWNLFGSTGRRAGTDGDDTLQVVRPINSYLSDIGVTRCPVDTGSSRSPDQPHHELYGTSYYYMARETNRIDQGRRIIHDGAWMIGGHRASEITRPDRKAVIADAVLPWRNPYEFPGDDPLNFWHTQQPEAVSATSTTQRLRVTMGFADGHVDQVRRKSGTLWANPANSTNASEEDVAGLLQVPEALEEHALPEEADENYY
jgi:prepilin-type N-terminal cleavage/methylation domain-containing protein/prepilin-type processing-associated H-X9-DG protein